MALLEACLAKPYRWLAVLHAWLVHVGKGARVDCLKLVALLFAIPVFEARYLLFQLIYASQERRLRLLGLEQRGARRQNGVQKVGGFLPNFGVGLERLNALRQVRRDLEARQSRRNSC